MGESAAAIRLIREQLREVVGRRTASAVAETRIQQLLQLYGEEEGVHCVLHTLLEEVFNEEEDKDEDGFVIFDREEIASVSTSTIPKGQVCPEIVLIFPLVS